MRIVCVDDEPLVLRLVTTMCEDLDGAPDVTGFTRACEALAWLETNDADVALLDIDMPDMSGLDLARGIQRLRPGIGIIFLTGYSEYAVEAFALHVSGYLLKPVNAERLAQEVAHATAGAASQAPSRVEVRTFGTFDVLVGGNPVVFPRARSKELLAYLVHRRGGSVPRKEAWLALWERGDYDRPAQKQLDTFIRNMRTALESAGIGDLVEMRSGMLRVKPELVDCDLYRFLSGDARARDSFTGEYLPAYPWARLTEGYLVRIKQDALDDAP